MSTALNSAVSPRSRSAAGCALALVAIDVGEDHASALGSERLGGGVADSGCRAR